MADQLASRLITESHELMQTVTAVATKDADAFWKEITEAPTGRWVVSDREQYSKGLFSYSQLPTQRTLLLKIDISEAYAVAWTAHQAQHGQRVEEDAFKLTYLGAVKASLVKFAGPQDKKFEFAFVHGLQDKDKKQHELFVKVSFSFELK